MYSGGSDKSKGISLREGTMVFHASILFALDFRVFAAILVDLARL